ncbi:MAG: CIA30 family protein [Phormidesmis sp.]
MSEQVKSQWDVVRFFTTLNTFGEIPFLGSFRWVQEWLGDRPTFSGKAFDARKKKIGVIGNIPEASRLALGVALKGVELIFLDQPQTNRPHNSQLTTQNDLTSQIRRVDTVLIWEASDFSTLITQLASSLSTNSEVVRQPVFDFTKESTDLAAWGELDDVVMGGTSKGAFLLTQPNRNNNSSNSGLTLSPMQQAVFTGVISTANSGGFSSVRTQNFQPAFDFSGWTGLQLRVKGDGQRYKFILRNSEDWDSPAYIYGFDTEAGTWVTISVPFTEMIPTFRAKSVPTATPFNPRKTVSFQLMLSKFEYDRQLNPCFEPGPFELAIETIEAYRERVGVPLVVVGNESPETLEQQRVILAESGLRYRLIEPVQDSDEQATLTAISSALA